MQVPVVQWIEQVPPKNQIQVRFLVGTPKHYHGASGDSSKLSAHHKKTTFRGGFFVPSGSKFVPRLAWNWVDLEGFDWVMIQSNQQLSIVAIPSRIA